MSTELLMGNEAIARAAIHAGVTVATGYPGTPSTEILETIARISLGDVHVEWSVNEKVALELAAGASYAGARSLVTMKQVGMNVASDPLMSFAYVGARGGCVIVVADDPGPISSQTEQDTRQFAQFAHIPVLDPVSPEHAYELTLRAFELSEAHRLPVILRPTTRICHGCASMDIPSVEERRIHTPAGFTKSPEFVIFPKLSREAHEKMTGTLTRISLEESAREIAVEKVGGTGAGSVAIVTSGDVDGYVREALHRVSVEVMDAPELTLINVAMPHPFPDAAVAEALDGITTVLAAEELEPVLERELMRLSGEYDLGLLVHGKRDGWMPVAGEYSADRIAPALAALLTGAEEPADPDPQGDPSFSPEDDRMTAPVAPPLPMRPPTLCPGCPHRAAFVAVKEAVGRRAQVVYSGDIGCYTLGNAAPLNTTDTCLDMGAGITIAQGLGIVEPDTVHIGFVGDSTFFASGMTGVANAVYNKHKMTVVVLDNATTAMTGAQHHPGTGVTLMGERSEPIRIAAVLEALGVTTIETADPLDRKASVTAMRKALADPGVSAVIFESPCIVLFPPLEPVHVDADACTGCEVCIRKLGCPALLFDDGKAHVDEALCNGCDLCVQFCRFDAIITPREGVPFPERAALRGGE